MPATVSTARPDSSVYMMQGGLLVADNAIDFEATLRPVLDRALADDRVDALIVPVGREN